jgi:hypothetical protein
MFFRKKNAPDQAEIVAAKAMADSLRAEHGRWKRRRLASVEMSSLERDDGVRIYDTWSLSSSYNRCAIYPAGESPGADLGKDAAKIVRAALEDWRKVERQRIFEAVA